MPAKTPNQIVAYNVARIRKELNGLEPGEWTQEKVVGKLADHGVKSEGGEPLSRANYSLMETSYERDAKIRNFDADLIVALSATFEVPVAWFYLPPEDDPELAYTVGADLDVDQWLERVWPTMDIRKAADPKAGVFVRRLLELARVYNQNAVQLIQESIQPQVAQAVAAAMPTVMQLARAVQAEYERSQFWLHSLRSYFDSDVVDPIWQEALKSMTREGEEE